MSSSSSSVGIVEAAAVGVACLIGWAIYKLLFPSQENKPLKRERWEKPPPGCYKLNFDGSDRHQVNSAGAGCIIRNDSGSVVVAAAYGLNRENVSFAEAEALKRGIQLARMLNLRVLYIEGDSQEIISRVNGAVPMKSNSKSTLKERKDDLIRDIKVEKERSFEYSEVKRVDRAANDVADKLAYWGATSLKRGEEKIWDRELPHSLPQNVIDALDKDSSSI